MNHLFNITKYHSAFTRSWDKSFSFNGEKHDFWEIVFVKQGSVIVTEEDRIYILEENQLILHAPMEFHRIRSAPQSSPKVKIMSFETSSNLPQELKNGIFTLNEEECDDFEYSFDIAREVFNNPLKSDLDFEESACRIKAFLLRIAKNKTVLTEYTSESALMYRRAASYMAENVRSNVTVKEIAESTYISQSYLKYLFKKYAGVSPKQYYNHLQIQHAKECLSNGFSINEIAKDMNFSSVNYFFFFYKKHTGATPLQHKNSRG